MSSYYESNLLPMARYTSNPKCYLWATSQVVRLIFNGLYHRLIQQQYLFARMAENQKGQLPIKADSLININCYF